jgi:hypothetical protein
MVAFERRMADQQIAEWSTEYLPYGKMKTMLKELVKRVSLAEAAAEIENANAVGTTDVELEAIEGGAARHDETEPTHRRGVSLTGTLAARTRGELIAVRSNETSRAPKGPGDDFDASSRMDEPTLVATVIDPENAALLSRAAAEEEKRFFLALDDSLRRVVAFYGDRAARCKREAASHASQLKHLKRAARRATRDFIEAERRAADRARGIETAWRGSFPRVASATALARELKRGFHHKDEGKDVSGSVEDDTKATTDSFQNHKQTRPALSVHDAKALVLKTAADARLLRRAVAESYRGANMLESYVSLNVEAFRKIVKKHDKLTGWLTQETYMKGLRELRVFHDDEIGNLRSNMEQYYLKIEETLCELEPERWERRFGENGSLGAEDSRHLDTRDGSYGHAHSSKNKKSGKNNLGFYEIRRRRNRVLAELRKDGRAGVVAAGGKRPQGPSFVAGIAVGCAVGLIALLVARVYESCEVTSATSGYFDRASCAAVTSIAPALRFPLLVGVHVVGYGALVRAWGETKVNAGFIFQAKRGTELPATGAALSGALGMCVWTAFAIALTQIARVEETQLTEKALEEDTVTLFSSITEPLTLKRTHYAAGVAFLATTLLFVAPLPKAWKRTGKLLHKYELRYPPDSTRRFFLRALFDGVAAPFKRVKMMDFFLMDQIVSQTTALRDWVLVMLLMLGAAEASARKHAPLIAVTPFWLRFLQTVRRFRDDGHKVHLVNAGKYASALIAVCFGLRIWYATREVMDHKNELRSKTFADETAFAAFVAANPEPNGPTFEMRASFVAFQAIATVYGAAWDFFMDWSVVSLVKQTSDESEEVITGAEGRTGPSRALTSASKKVSTLALPYGYRLRWLERRTMMKSRWKYGLAVATNLILRHFWIVAAVPDAREGMALGAEAWVTVVALVEVLRRCAWSYFRVENEHATNCGMFRATLEVPLPFHDGELTDDEEDAAGPSTKEKAAAPEDPVAFGRAERIPTKRRVSLDAADGADGASVAFASPSVPSALARKRSAGAEELAGLSESDRRRSLDAAPADAQLAVSEDDRGEGGSGRSDRSGRSDDGSDRSVSSDEDSSARAARRFSLVHSDTEDFDSDAPMEPGSIPENGDGDGGDENAPAGPGPITVKPREKHFPRVGTPPLKRTKSRFGREPSSPPRTRRSSLTIEVNVPTPSVVSAAASGGGGGASPQQQRISRGLEAIAKLVESSQSLQSADSDALAGDGAEESERRGEAGESEP